MSIMWKIGEMNNDFEAEVMTLRLKFVHCAYVNMHVAVNLHLSGSIYDTQKLRYRIWPLRAPENQFFAIISKSNGFEA